MDEAAGAITGPHPGAQAATGRGCAGRAAREKWASVATSLNSRRVAATATARQRSRNATASSAPARRASAAASSATAGASAADGPGSSLRAPRWFVPDIINRTTYCATLLSWHGPPATRTIAAVRIICGACVRTPYHGG